MPGSFFAAFLAVHSPTALLQAACYARYGRYVAAVKSDSQTVMLEIAAPFGTACICCAVCS
jgi:hypothetical protein